MEDQMKRILTVLAVLMLIASMAYADGARETEQTIRGSVENAF